MTATLKSYTFEELLKLEVPPRTLMLGHWLAESDLVMVFAARGVGKTFFALNVAYAVASGTQFLNFAATGPRRVLYVDGEMKINTLQERLRLIQDHADQGLHEGFFRMVPYDKQPDGIPDLATTEGQDAVDGLLEQDTKLLILDNLSTLVKAGRENESESWTPIQAWLLALRKRGVAVLIVHHAGKSGMQRGASKREDALDAVIELRQTEEAWKVPGASFQVRFTKMRSFSEHDAPPIDVRLDPVTGIWSWTSTLNYDRNARIVELHRDGVPQKNIATEVGLSRAQVSKIIAKFQNQSFDLKYVELPSNDNSIEEQEADPPVVNEKGDVDGEPF